MMRWMITLVVVLGLTAGVYCAKYVPASQVTRDVFLDVESCNDYIDGLVEELRSRFAVELEPYRLRDWAGNFGWLMYRVDMSLEEGRVVGLSDLRRKDDCVISISATSGHKINVTLGTELLNMSVLSKLKAAFGFVGMDVNVTATTDRTRFRLTLDFDKATGRPRMDSLTLVDEGTVDFKTDFSFKVVDALMSKMLKYVRMFWRRSAVGEEMVEALKGMINDMLKND